MLQVCVTRHDRVGVGLGLLQQRFLQFDQIANELNYTRGPFEPPYFVFPRFGASSYIELYGLTTITPDLVSAKPTTRVSVTLPPDAKPGTYEVILKGHRAFKGERVSRMNFFKFQVGQLEPTSYPNRVGNCQICHRGVLSLENVLHGAGVDDIEACKTCHDEKSQGALASDLPIRIHNIHMQSRKYPLDKRDCTVCHLTRESATRPSAKSCGACHLQIHGADFFGLSFQEPEYTPNGFGNCANACHVTQLPSQHFLPSN